MTRRRTVAVTAEDGHCVCVCLAVCCGLNISARPAPLHGYWKHGWRGWHTESWERDRA